MNKRKLITISTILILLFNCMIPLMQVWAVDEQTSTEGTAVNGELDLEFNTKLYNGVKSNLVRLNATARYNDKQRKIKVLESDVNAVTSLVLSNFGINDLTGLEIFKNVTSIDLSANKLTKDSNLEVLNNFNLEFLDISSNEIEDVSMLTKLNSIKKVNLHNQKFNYVETIAVDDSSKTDEATTVTFELPQIIQKAGFLESEWVIDYYDRETGYSAPSIKWKTFGKSVTVTIANKVGDVYVPTRGMVRIKLQIKDPTNIMFNSDINLFYVTYSGSTQQAIVFKDEALYRAVKQQLTKDQGINQDIKRYTDRENLYDVAYDNNGNMFDPLPMVLVIDLDDLLNKIISLKLESKGIADPTGLEWFLGLERELNLYDNKIENIDTLFSLRENKIAMEQKMRDIVAERIAAIKTTYTRLDSLRKTIISLENSFRQYEKELAELNAKRNTEAANGNSTEAIDNQIASKVEQGDTILANLSKAKIEFNSLIPQLELRMQLLYGRYSKEYKFTSILTPEINLMTDEVFASLKYDEGKALFNSQASRFASIEGTLTQYEKGYLIDYYGIPTVEYVEEQVKDSTGQPVKDGNGRPVTQLVPKAIENPIGKFFSEMSANYSESEASLSTYKQRISEFKTLEVIFKMANYTIIDRLYSGENYIDTIQDDQYTPPYDVINLESYVSYLEKLIEDKKDDYQSTFYLESILNNLEDILINGTYGMDSLENYGFNVYDYVTFPQTYETLVPSEIYAIAGKFANTTSAEIQAYVTIPQLKRLNIGGNLIESLEGIEVFEELRYLYARKNQIFNINNVNWSALVNLQELDLAFNDLYDVKCLEVLVNLVYLDLSKNLIEGKFNFDFSRMEKLKKLYFSENRLTDISLLKTLLEWVARDHNYYNIAEYMGSPDAPDIRFWGQVLNMDFEVEQSQQLIMIDAPVIFSQLKEMDFSRTIFGANSVYGNLTNDGKKIILEATKLGKKTGAVYVESGTAGPGIGLGTICTLNYEVVEKVNKPDTPLIPDPPKDPDDIPFGTSYTIKGGEYIMGISPNTSVSVFKSKLLSDTENYTVRVTADREITDTEKVATGMVVTIRDKSGEVIDVYETVVKGDANGDGAADSLDSGLIKAHRGEYIMLTGVFFEAADINQDGIVDALDSKLLLYHRAEIEGYIL